MFMHKLSKKWLTAQILYLTPQINVWSVMLIADLDSVVSSTVLLFRF